MAAVENRSLNKGRIFINYRREISAAAAGRLFDRLLQHFDRECLFMDVDGIEPGVDFIKTLDDQLLQCSLYCGHWSGLDGFERR